jgi:hypothetical protein
LVFIASPSIAPPAAAGLETWNARLGSALGTDADAEALISRIMERVMKSGSKDHWKDIGTNEPEKRPGPYAQDRSRTPPDKEQRERDYDPKKVGPGGDGDRMDAVMRQTPL